MPLWMRLIWLVPVVPLIICGLWKLQKLEEEDDARIEKEKNEDPMRRD